VRRRSTLVRRSPHRSPLRPTAPRGCLVPPSACFLTTQRPLLAANGKRTTENLFWLSSFLGAKMGIVFGNIVGTRIQLLQCPHVAMYQFAKPYILLESALGVWAPEQFPRIVRVRRRRLSPYYIVWDIDL
jgi:hypothetical protein